MIASMEKIIPAIALQFVSVLILTFFWVGTALADKRVALIVGNNQYVHITPKLACPANDAHDLAQALESVGFEVILRTDVRTADIGQLLTDFQRKVSGADVALFYYAGHGVRFHGRNFFLPVDIDVQDAVDVQGQALIMDDVQQVIDTAAGVKIVILDASRNNPLAEKFKPVGGGGIIFRPVLRRTGLITVYSSAPDKVAPDCAGRSSPFTESLIRRIKEPGLEIGTMFRRVVADVYERTNGRQRPEYSGSLLSDYFLNPTESDKKDTK
jgi:uncharacterized caspase-like protein